MHIMLDDEQWTIEDGVSLMEVLAQISDKAYAKQRVITSLRLGEREITDRDLTGGLLAQLTHKGSGMDILRAMTQSMEQVVKGADQTVARYARLLKVDGAALVQDIRAGHTPGDSLDAWLGRLADYLECIVHQPVQASPDSSSQNLALWVSRLLDARLIADWIAVADVIEYEITPRLPG